MGLKVNLVSEIPDHVAVGYYLYLLDYGWHEPLSEALRQNFDRIAGFTSKNNAAVIMGFDSEFNDSVLSWHGVNGQDGNDLLPALLITNKPPAFFQEHRGAWDKVQDHLVIIPLRQICRDATGVIGVIERILSDIQAGRDLREFQVAQQIRAGRFGALVDAVILQPNFAGVGVDLKKVFSWLRGGR